MNISPQISTILLLSFPLTLLAQPGDFLERRDLVSPILAEQFSDDFTDNDSPQELNQPSLQPTANQKPRLLPAGISLVPRVALGIISFRYKEDYSATSDVEWSDNMPYAGIGVTLDYGNFALDIYGQQTMSGSDSLFETAPESILTVRDYNTNLSRRDVAINGSYGIQNLLTDKGDSLLFSVGYKWGKTDINGLRRRTISTGTEPSYTNYDTEETEFTSSGPSLGITYGYPIGENSRIGINLAYSWLGSEHSNSSIKVDNSQGWTGGLSWISSITHKISYSLSFDYYTYPYGTTNYGEGLFGYTTEEEATSFNAAISYAFDL